jgi:hypothetical protein
MFLRRVLMSLSVCGRFSGFFYSTDGAYCFTMCFKDRIDPVLELLPSRLTWSSEARLTVPVLSCFWKLFLVPSSKGPAEDSIDREKLSFSRSTLQAQLFTPCP